MEHRWKIYELDGYLEIEFDDIKELVGDKTTLALWLTGDLGHEAKNLDIIDDILKGSIEFYEFCGNAFNARVNSKCTEIYCVFKEEVTNIKPCKLPTKLLREIVAVWLEEFEKYRNSKN